MAPKEWKGTAYSSDISVAIWCTVPDCSFKLICSSSLAGHNKQVSTRLHIYLVLNWRTDRKMASIHAVKMVRSRRDFLVMQPSEWVTDLHCDNVRFFFSLFITWSFRNIKPQGIKRIITDLLFIGGLLSTILNTSPLFPPPPKKRSLGKVGSKFRRRRLILTSEIHSWLLNWCLGCCEAELLWWLIYMYLILQIVCFLSKCRM